MAYNHPIDARALGIPGGSIVYNDLLGNITGAKLPAVNFPVWTDITLDGFTFKLPAFSVGDTFDIYYQTHHGVALNTILENHIHWTLATDDDGDEIRFQIEGVGAGIGDVFQHFGPLDSGDIVLSGNAGRHNYLDINDIPAINTTVSSVFVIRLTRIAVNDGNDSAELVYVWFNDSHAKLDTLGSIAEASKTE